MHKNKNKKKTSSKEFRYSMEPYMGATHENQDQRECAAGMKQLTQSGRIHLTGKQHFTICTSLQ